MVGIWLYEWQKLRFKAMKIEKMYGVFIEKGISEWQIVQQTDGYGKVCISGTWKACHENSLEFQVYLCVKKEDTGEMVLGWTKCGMSGNSWKLDVEMPVGGLYRIETCLSETGEWSEWAVRGDMVPHVGVGDFYVIAGQSNAAGYGCGAVYDPCELGVHILKNDGSWHLASHPLNDFTGADAPANLEEGNPRHSFGLSFGKFMKRELHYPIGLIQTAKGGTPLSAWDPSKGSLYGMMLERIRLAGGKVKGMVWYQGCSDAMGETCDDYEERFLKFYHSLCQELQLKELPVILCQINQFLGNADEKSDRAWGMLREQQRRLGKHKNIYLVPTTDCSLSDPLHISASANLMLGERIARKALSALYGKKFLSDAPELIAAQKIKDDTVLLKFTSVYEKLEMPLCAPEKLAFTAEDSEGMTEVAEYELLGADCIRLRFKRKLLDGCVLHGGYETKIDRILLIDVGSRLPMVSFYQYPITKKE